MFLHRSLALLVSATLPLGSMGCGMYQVGTGEAAPTDADAHAKASHPADTDTDTDAHAPAPTPADADTDAGTDAATSVNVSSADSGNLPTCRPSGAACTGTADCCGGLSCTGDEDERRCK
jgi:hypothetical protein